MKKMLPWIILLAISGSLAGWIYVTHSEAYQAGLMWVRKSPEINNDVGLITHIYPDFRRYRISSSGGWIQAHFSVFVHGKNKTDEIELFVQKDKSNWHVVRAKKDGESLSVK
jgi:hypothetical protein